VDNLTSCQYLRRARRSVSTPCRKCVVGSLPYRDDSSARRQKRSVPHVVHLRCTAHGTRMEYSQGLVDDERPSGDGTPSCWTWCCPSRRQTTALVQRGGGQGDLDATWKPVHGAQRGGVEGDKQRCDSRLGVKAAIMREGVIPKASAVVVAASISFLMIPGCVITIGPGGGDEGAGGKTSQTDPNQTPPPPGTDDRTDDELLAAVNQQALSFASAKATVATCALHGAIDTLPLDPASLDDATVLGLMEQYMPTASEQTDLWLASIDPSTIQAGVISKDSCLEQYGCEWHPQCQYGFDPGISHLCIITDCGAARCSWCPSWVPDLLKHLAIKAWCSYVCVQTGITSPPVVALGAGGISSLGGHFVGPVCMAP